MDAQRERNLKTFKGDFDFFVNKIKNNEHFSLSRWGDGELMILENKAIDLTQKGDGEFKHDPTSMAHLKMREIMMDSYTHQDDNYYIGVACRCCVGDEKFEYMKRLSGQPESNLTWANIFVNSNYKYFLKDFLNALQGKKIVLVANKNSKLANMPFYVEKFYPVSTDAWINDAEILQHMQMEIGEFNIKDHVYLFAAGPFANLLTYKLWQYNKENTYIDIGSTLDRFLGLKITRMYLQGADTLNKTCIW